MKEDRGIRIASLIAARGRGDISPEEETVLEEWLAERDEHRALYARLTAGEQLHRRLDEYEACSLENVRARVLKEIARRSRGRSFVFRRVARVASLLFIPLLLAGVGWYLNRERSPHLSVSLFDMVPGSGQVTLEVAGGERVDLAREGAIEVGGTTAHNDAGRILYPEGAGVGEEPVYNVLTTARGGEYGLVLADGTWVWMNAASRLRYPVAFGGEAREVYLEGEAYFDVARRAEPFRVHVRGTVIEVLGTSFNVMGYPDEGGVEATLVSGKVRVSRKTGGESVELLPGQQARVEENGGEAIAVREVNASVYASWTGHLFVFDDESMEVIARKLARWYDVEIELTSSSVRDASFYGVLPKYATITVFLERMRQVYDMEYTVEGRKIVLK
ncbi:MAG: DUF4974 domain-containing protein [Odoribacteraceae bacterium]|jgi:ferric-dicitrate binding protein FerR (iron transport regulator)|nr:DUF4974 domain-containing protein [Odoribacteraceae bacterium]